MKRVLGISLAVAFAISTIAAPAVAGNAYGNTIKDECGASFGQLRQLSPHPVTPSKGAKYFAEELIGTHCP